MCHVLWALPRPRASAVCQLSVSLPRSRTRSVNESKIQNDVVRTVVVQAVSAAVWDMQEAAACACAIACVCGACKPGMVLLLLHAACTFR